MQHSSVLFILLGLFIIIGGGVFVLVNQEGENLVIEEELLVGGIGLIENESIVQEKTEEDKDTNNESLVDIEEIITINEIPKQVEQKELSTNNNEDFVEDIPIETEETEEKQITECEIDSSLIPKQDTVIFNEIAWMGTPYSSQDEWMELKNISGETVYLQGWQIFDADKDIAIIFEENITFLPQNFFILERTDDTTLPRTGADTTYTGALNNTDEILYLFDEQCHLQDIVKADPDWPAGDKVSRQSMERSQDMDWHTYNRRDITDNIFGTPKKENNLPAPQEPEELDEPVSFEPYFPGGQGQEQQLEPETEETYLKLLISEIQTEGETVKDEFVEIYNPNNTSVNLQGWSLKKKTSGGTESNLVSSAKFSETVTSLGYFLIVPQLNDDGTQNYKGSGSPDLLYSGKTYSFAKNNTVLLYNPAGEIVDKVGFGNAQDFEGAPASNPAANQSLGRKFIENAYQDTDNNAQDFEIQTPTPNTRNQALTQTQTEEDLPIQEDIPQKDGTQDPANGEVGCAEGQIDVNSASKEELLNIIHIGDSRADGLITLRPFSSLDDLVRISGIGDGRVQDIKEQGIACVANL